MTHVGPGRLDKDIDTFLRAMTEAGAPAYSDLTPAAARELLEARSSANGLAPEEVGAVTDMLVPSGANPVACRLYRPTESGRRPAVVFFHGGGWVIGSLDTADRLCRVLCNQLGSIIVSVGYRLAPEHPFPAGVDDGWQVMRWLRDSPDALPDWNGTLAVAGESSGGSLAVAMALMARDAGLKLDAQLLFYPALDSSRSSRSYEAFANGYSLTSTTMAWFWEQYLGPAGASADARATPAILTDARGLPPLALFTAEFDVLRDEGEAYADLVRAANQLVITRRYAGLVHGFIGLSGVAGAAAAAVQDLARSARTLLDVVGNTR